MRHALWAAALAAVLAPCPARGAETADVNRAIDAGVRALRKLQKPDGSWEFANPHTTTGVTSLAGLTLLECGADKDDPAVVSAAKFVRARCAGLRFTYSISLAILFLDRFGNPEDEQLIESLASRLVAGQLQSGVWTYNCPDSSTIDPLFAQPNSADPSATPSAKGTRRRELTESERKTLGFARRVVLLRQQGGVAANVRGDNSNAQFALLALWACRRHGLPVENSLGAVVRHFRDTQVSDGQWMYDDGGVYGGPSATMTCAGLLGLAVGHGLVNSRKDAGAGAAKNRDPDNGGGDDGNKTSPKPDGVLAADRRLKAGLIALSAYVDLPLLRLSTSPPEQGGVQIRPSVAGRGFFVLWSVGRVGVALDLDTIGGKKWYDWGAAILLATQTPAGTWEGSYAQGGVDTCFALLFLKRANFLEDLSKLNNLHGRMRDPGRRLLHSGGVSGAALGPGTSGANEVDPAAGSANTPGRAPALPIGPALGDSPGDKLAAALVALPAERQEAEIERLRDQKGAVHTEALAAAIPFLGPDTRRKARAALAERESRMRLDTIGRDLHDNNPEIRRAAAQACALKESRNKETRRFIPQLIGLLSDPEVVVSRAAHEALKDLTGEDFGPASGAAEAERKRAAEQWQDWWKKQAP